MMSTARLALTPKLGNGIAISTTTPFANTHLARTTGWDSKLTKVQRVRSLGCREGCTCLTGYPG